MNSTTGERLLELNRRFYAERGRDFSETRVRVQPGVRRILQSLDGDESILDLGCGNGALAQALSARGHRGEYLGMDFSGPLLERARQASYTFPVSFVERDLMNLDAEERSAFSGRWSLITAFAVLHHIPGRGRRLSLIAAVRSWLKPGALFIHSNWQFSSSERMRARIQPWSSLGLEGHEVDEGDYLVDWRRGGKALRYVHEFREDELADLAAESGFIILDTFRADGADGSSGLYGVWQPG